MILEVRLNNYRWFPKETEQEDINTKRTNMNGKFYTNKIHSVSFTKMVHISPAWDIWFDDLV